MLELLDAGMSVQGIALRAHLDPHTVRRALDTSAQRMRGKSAAALLAIEAGRRRPGNQGRLWDG
ncbi:MAG TPA: hypothetical protein VF365_12960 [Candidatus Limnocylindria bacterium]